MKKLMLGLLMALAPALGMANETPFIKTEISIRPLQPGVSVETGVLGQQVFVDVNGRKIIHDAIYLTGAAAKMAVTNANNLLIAAGKTAVYTFDSTRQMIVVTGALATEILKGVGKGASYLGKELYNGAQVVLYETYRLTNITITAVGTGLAEVYAFSSKSLTTVIAKVKIIAAETTDTVKDLASFAYENLRLAAEASINLVVNAASASMTLARAALVLVTDAGMFVYDHAKSGLVQLGTWGKAGLKLANKGIHLGAKATGAVVKVIFNSLKAIYSIIPSVRVSIEVQ